MALLIIHSLADRLVILTSALLLACVFMPYPIYKSFLLQRPIKRLHQLAIKLEAKLNRLKRSAGKRVYRGIIMLSFFVLLSLLFSMVVHVLEVRFVWAQYLEFFLIAYLIPIRYVWDQSRRMNQPLEKQKIDTARGIMGPLLRRKCDAMDEHACVRTNLEWMMRKFSAQVVAPSFWYVLLGLPGLCIYRVISLLDHHIGYRSDHYFAFGWASARLDDVLQWIPARLAGIYLVLSSFFIPRCKPIAALHMLLVGSSQMVSSNRGMTIATTAGALGISLGGPRRVADTVVDDPWVGFGTAKANIHDLARGQWLYLASCVMMLLSLGILAAMFHHVGPIEDFWNWAQSFIGNGEN